VPKDRPRSISTGVSWDGPRRRRPGKNYEARERPALRHDGAPGIEVRIYKVEGNRDGAKIIVFSDAAHRFVSLADVKSTDWDALAQRGTLKANVARQARRIRSYLRGRADSSERTNGHRCGWRASLGAIRPWSLDAARVPQSAGGRRRLRRLGVSVVWLDRPPPNADQFLTWEQILNGC
jgi:hypothetical protein